MKKPHIWISDLTHTAQGISANTFPLGVSYVYSYAKQQLGKDFNFKLFKFPSSSTKRLILYVLFDPILIISPLKSLSTAVTIALIEQLGLRHNRLECFEYEPNISFIQLD